MIEISLCRISADGMHLDLIFSAPNEYEFTSLSVTTLHLKDGDFVEQHFDIQDIFNPLKSNYVLRIPLEKFGLKDIPAIYQIQLSAYKKGVPEGQEPPIYSYATISDVNSVYQSILDDILGMGDRCAGLSDEAIKKYLILYAHQAALYTEDLDEAKMLFKILINNFAKCGGSKRKSNCGTSYNPSYVKSNCGCKS